MANAEHVNTIRQGPAAWNQWRRDHPDVPVDLRAAHLPDCDLCGVVLSGVTLSVAVLNRADLSGANLRGADLSSANLTEADLSNADLHAADLRGSNLSRADLRNADLSAVDMRSGLLVGADLDGADLSGANLSSTLMHEARNLTIEQLCSARTLWLTELHDRLGLVEAHCPDLLLRPPTGSSDS